MGRSTKALRIFLPLKLYLVKMMEIGRAIRISIPTAIAAIEKEYPRELKMFLHWRFPIKLSLKTSLLIIT